MSSQDDIFLNTVQVIEGKKQTYKYTGIATVSLSGYGIVREGETITIPFIINNPLFEEIKTASKKDKKHL